MISRLYCIGSTHKVAVASLFILMVLTSLPAVAQQTVIPATQQGRKLTLRDQLTLGLRAFTKADKAFIDKVVILVEQKKLPRSLVDSTFLWARQRAVRHSRSRRLRPIVYFQPGLTQRARRLGIKL